MQARGEEGGRGRGRGGQVNTPPQNLVCLSPSLARDSQISLVISCVVVDVTYSYDSRRVCVLGHAITYSDSNLKLHCCHCVFEAA